LAAIATATVRDGGSDARTLRLQSSRILRFYLEELHVLGGELSLAAHLADVSKDLRALAGRSPDTSPHRSGELYGWRCPAFLPD